MKVEQIHDKVILYASLDWGFGHVTRSIGIIQQLLSQHNSVIIACNSEQKIFFKSYFPNLRYEYLSGYNIKFNNKGNWTIDLLKSSFNFLNGVRNDKNFVQIIEQTTQIDLVISDHRYGFYSSKAQTIFITHQLHLPISSFFKFVQNWHEKQLNKFSIVWVLDTVQHEFAGNLSKPITHNCLQYIGLYSRLKLNQDKAYKYDYLIVISGPSVYAPTFISELKSKVNFFEKRVAVLYPPNYAVEKELNFSYFEAKDLKENDELFYLSETIISRFGYSTLMDLIILNKKGKLIPTKGQAEQKYLAKIAINSEFGV